ncbi:unnamed protein product [Bursaphelenchus xylophilus]|uniref:(pine wood nematode) hypothetical protein n=1 Tax=Bursaphelenchus xylophilus TaxID=6326 RepID=A0A811K6P1_BURXY|nr:unnamed protein product [Bursaphelenchus xylophilus]CAG9088969.1 unnamed protein product [Bursaphelenchus xylophilus]
MRRERIVTKYVAKKSNSTPPRRSRRRNASKCVILGFRLRNERRRIPMGSLQRADEVLVQSVTWIRYWATILETLKPWLCTEFEISCASAMERINWAWKRRII